ncbi:O-antigen ligase family protein [candidate division KSB1 bacterium]|nr:O-antigen ligase family protein [candidate division KSB1 bacterium]
MNSVKLDIYLKNVYRSFLYIFAAAVPFYIFIPELSIGILLLTWLARILITKRLRFRKIGLEWAFLAFVLAEFISLPFSTNLMQSFIYLKRLLLFPIVYFLATGIDEESDLKKMVYIFIIASGVYSFTGIISYIINPAVRVSHIHNAMTAGGITMLSALAGFAVGFKTINKRWKVLFLFIAILNSVCLILTATRGSWVGFFIGLMVIFFYVNKKLLLFIPVFLLVFYLLLPANFKYRVENIFNPKYESNALRLHWWKVGVKIFTDHPLVGIGDVGAGDVYRKYKDPDEKVIGHFHNNFVHIAVTLGSVGFLAFLFMTISIFVQLIRQLKKLKSGWCLAALAMFAAFHVNGLFEWNFGDQEIITIIWFTIGLAMFQKISGPDSQIN